jgi:hypothetical protein
MTKINNMIENKRGNIGKAYDKNKKQWNFFYTTSHY